RKVLRSHHALRSAHLLAEKPAVNDKSKPARTEQQGFATRAIHAGQEPDPATGAIMTPIYATSTYVQTSPGVHKRYDYARIANPEGLRKAIRPETKMIWVETPSNPLLKLIDLVAVAKIARERELIAVADNTFASPWIQRPLELGFDIVVHSATKYLNGHSDIIGGVVVIGGEARHAPLAESLAYLQNAV